MKEYHLHPDKQFIIRQDNKLIAILEESEILQFSQISLPQGCTEILVGTDGIVYATINKAMGGINHNPLQELISKEQEIIAFYEAKLAAQQEPQE
jgi:hypothetical protein